MDMHAFHLNDLLRVLNTVSKFILSSPDYCCTTETRVHVMALRVPNKFFTSAACVAAMKVCAVEIGEAVAGSWTLIRMPLEPAVMASCTRLFLIHLHARERLSVTLSSFRVPIELSQFWFYIRMAADAAFPRLKRLSIWDLARRNNIHLCSWADRFEIRSKCGSQALLDAVLRHQSCAPADLPRAFVTMLQAAELNEFTIRMVWEYEFAFNARGVCYRTDAELQLLAFQTKAKIQ